MVAKNYRRTTFSTNSGRIISIATNKNFPLIDYRECSCL